MRKFWGQYFLQYSYYYVYSIPNSVHEYSRLLFSIVWLRFVDVLLIKFIEKFKLMAYNLQYAHQIQTKSDKNQWYWYLNTNIT